MTKPPEEAPYKIEGEAAGPDTLLKMMGVGVLNTGNPVLLATTLEGELRLIVVALRKTGELEAATLATFDPEGAADGVLKRLVTMGDRVETGSGVREMIEKAAVGVDEEAMEEARGVDPGTGDEENRGGISVGFGTESTELESIEAEEARLGDAREGVGVAVTTTTENTVTVTTSTLTGLEGVGVAASTDTMGVAEPLGVLLTGNVGNV